MISYKYPVTSPDTDLKLDNEDVLEELHFIDDKDPYLVLLKDRPDDLKESITDPYLELANDLLEILDVDNDREKTNFGRLDSSSLEEFRLLISIFQRKKPNPGVLRFSELDRF